MKNRLKLFLEEDSGQPEGGKGSSRQCRLIALHHALSREMEDADSFLKGHYEHLLLSLKRLIESYGPGPDYERWANSISAS